MVFDYSAVVDGLLKVNRDHIGFYRVNHDHGMWDAIRDQLQRNHLVMALHLSTQVAMLTVSWCECQDHTQTHTHFYTFKCMCFQTRSVTFSSMELDEC